MPHLIEFDDDRSTFRLGLLRVSFGELLDPGHPARGRDAQQLGGAVHRQPAQVQQHGRDLDPQRHAARRGVGEVQPAGLAAVALQALHEAVPDVPLAAATLAPQPHRPAPPAVPSPTDMGRLRSLKTLYHIRFNKVAHRRSSDPPGMKPGESGAALPAVRSALSWCAASPPYSWTRDPSSPPACAKAGPPARST